ncbi:hypothetical protein C5167_012397 [Papaver somniferum]|uniref:Uncharacterized protein n=1 Tax=Papaver somniferum TaxID=3469 RepID=A0A4Y7J0J1_PAPSO|nr:hypothetical protein C5167_012397 [Papaver somniferum]
MVKVGIKELKECPICDVALEAIIEFVKLEKGGSFDSSVRFLRFMVSRSEKKRENFIQGSGHSNRDSTTSCSS